MSEVVRVLIVDDNALIRLGLREALSNNLAVEIVGEADSAADALAKYTELLPDVVTVDYRMPDCDGIQCVDQLLEHFEDAKTIMLSIYEGEDIIIRASRSGVKGYLSKDCSIEMLHEAISEVASGGRYFPASIANVILEHSDDQELSARELDVLRQVAAGSSNKDIAENLSISLPTVKMHMTNTMKKLCVLDRTQLLIAAIKKGIVEVD